MKSTGIAFICVGLLLISGQTFSQSKSISQTTPILIDENRSAIYLEFVRTGICHNGNYFTTISVGPCEKKSNSDREFEAVWVRLVNNSRWAVSVSVQKSAPLLEYSITLPNKAVVSAARDKSELDVIYDIESETGCDFHEEVSPGQPCKRRETPVPDYDRHFFYSDVFIPPGHEILYAIDKAHLKKYLTTYVLYSFEWEIGKNGRRLTPTFDSQHRVYFSRYDFEAGMQKNTKK